MSGASTALWVGLILLAAGLLSLGLLATGALTGAARDRRGIRQILHRYGKASATDPTGGRPAGHGAGALGDSQVARTALDWAGRVARKRGLEERLALRLDRAGLHVTPSEWLLLLLGGGVAGLIAGAVLFHSPLVALGVAVLAVAGPSFFLRVKANRRRAAFADQLPDSLRLAASSLKSGYSFVQALDALVREGTEPISSEVGRALAESRIGVPVEDALDQVADRMDSIDMRWTVMAVRVQREVGGNLAEVLDTVSDTIRERAYLKRQVHTLSAEGRLSAYVLIGLPLTLAGYMFAFRRDYVHPLYSTFPGVAMLTIGGVLLVAGWLTMKKIIKVEV